MDKGIIKPSVTSRDLLARKLVSNNIYDRMDELESRFNDYIRAEITADTAEEIVGGDLGLMQIGETRYGNGVDPGSGWTGIRIVYPGVDYDGNTYLFATAIADMLRVGITEDGILIAGGGMVSMDETGITANAGFIGGFVIDSNRFYSDGGNFFIDSSQISIGLGATDYLTGTGFWVGKNLGTYKMHIGNPAGEYLYWDGTNLGITGGITATWGNIGGWEITATKIESTTLELDSSNERVRSKNYIAGQSGFNIDSNLIEANNLKARGSIEALTMAYKSIQASGGTAYYTKSVGKLLSNFTSNVSANFAVDINDPTYGHAQLFEIGDYLLVESVGGLSKTTNWLVVESIDGDHTGFYRYTCSLPTVDGNPQTEATFYAGCPVVDIGQEGAGIITISCDETIGASPNISMSRFSGSPGSFTTFWRGGNLNDLLGNTSDIYGLAIGENLASLENYNGLLIAVPSVILNDIEGTPRANLVGMNNGKAQVWISAVDGNIGFAGGSGQLNSEGIKLTGEGRYLTQMATVGSESRVGRIGMVDDGSGKPKWLLDYFNPIEGTPIELLLSDGNGNFETGDLTGWERQGDDIWEIEDSVINSGSYAVKATYPYSAFQNDCYLRTDPIEVTGGKFYTLSAYQCNSIEGVEFDIGIRFYLDIDGLIQTGNLFKLSETSELNYTQYQVVALAPSDAQTARVVLQVYMPDTGTAIHYFDDVSLLESDETISSQLALTDDGIKITGDITADNISSSGWMKVTEQWTRVVGSQAVTATGNFTSKYQKGDKVKFVQNNIQKFLYVTAVSYSAGTGRTTISLCGGSDYTVDAGTISNVYYSRASDPFGFPAYFNYTVAWTATSNPDIKSGTLTGKFKIEGTLVWVQVIMTAAADTTFGSGSWVFSLPVSMQTSFGVAYLLDNGTADRMGLVNAGTVASVISYGGSNISATFPWTWAANDRCWFTVTGNMS